MNRDSLKKKQGRRERGGERKKRRGKRRGPRGEEAEQPFLSGSQCVDTRAE